MSQNKRNVCLVQATLILNTGLMSNRVQSSVHRKKVPLFSFWLAILSIDGVIMKIPYVVDILSHRPALHPSFPIGLVKTESLDQLRLTKGDERRW